MGKPAGLNPERIMLILALLGIFGNFTYQWATQNATTSFIKETITEMKSVSDEQGKAIGTLNQRVSRVEVLVEGNRVISRTP